MAIVTGLFTGFFALIWLSVCIGATVFWLWMLVDCAKKEPNYGNTKIVWILIIALTHWFGALLYFFFRRPKRIEEY